MLDEGEVVQSASLVNISKLGIARVYQSPRPFDELTCLENIAIALSNPKNDATQAERWLKLVDLENQSDSFASDLPFGSKKKLDLARALATEPKALLLDEPTSGLTDSEVKTLCELIKAISDTGMTLVIVDHNMDFVRRVCSRVLILKQGAIADDVAAPDLPLRISCILIHESFHDT